MTVADATAGKAAVESAISVLKGFYENAFVQAKKYLVFLLPAVVGPD